MGDYDYVARAISRLARTDRYAIKVEARGVVPGDEIMGELGTHWLTISPEQLTRVLTALTTQETSR